MGVGQKKYVVVLGIGLLLAIIGVTLLLCFPLVFRYLLQKQIPLINGTVSYKAWQDIPFPISQKLYFFNITNGEGFMRRREKPILQEVGPFTFRSRWIKKQIKWYPNGTVSFKEVKTFVFLRNESVGSLDTKIVTLNAPLLIAANFLKNYDLPVRLAASFLLGVAGERLIVTKSIKQLAFDGYKDIIILLSPILKKDIPFKDGLFAWLYGKNDTDDGRYTVFTGETDLDLLNVIDNWNGRSTLPYWKGTCGDINGTNAEMGPPLKTNQKTYTFFQSIFCRSITLSYTEDVYCRGLAAKRFMTTRQTFANGTDNHDNACFVTENKFRSGVQDISRCQFGAPVLLSFPHFYFADPWYTRMVDGIKPNSSLHVSHLDIEPNTGFSINGAIKFQINMFIQKIRGIAQLSDLPKVVFPVFWIDISFELTEELSQMFQRKILIPKFIAYVCLSVLIAVGSLLTFAAIVIISYRRWQGKMKVPLSEGSESLLSDSEQ